MQPHIGVDHADQRHVRKIQTLGDHLRAEENVNQSFTESGQDTGMTAGLAHGVAVHAADDMARETFLDFDLQFLCAQSLVAYRCLSAERAVALRLLLETAVMTEQDVALFVVGQCQIAEAARFDVAARRAMHMRREAAAIEKQHHLSALVECRAHRVFQCIADGRRPAPLGRLMTQVNQTHLGQRPFQHALGQTQERILAALGVVPALQRRSRRAKYDWDVLQPRPHDGHISAMIARRGFLFEGVFMLFIDNDEAEPFGRREDGAASADDDLRLARRYAPPVSAALRVAQMTMKHGHLAAAAAKALDRLRRQADFRHHYQRFLALGNDLFDGAQINLGFAAAGDAVQQKRMESALLQRRFQLIPYAELIAVEGDWPRWYGLLVGGIDEAINTPSHASGQSLL